MIYVTKQPDSGKPASRDGPDGTLPIVFTSEMMEAALKAWRRWEESDDPDPRRMVRELVSASLGARVSFGS